MRREKTLATQAAASGAILTNSQSGPFPVKFRYADLQLEVHRSVFSPLHFSAWKPFTSYVRQVRIDALLEIGCGCGVTALSALKSRTVTATAVDISPAAVVNTVSNAEANDLVGRVDVRLGDVYSSLDPGSKFDVIYWNLPFIWTPPTHRIRDELELSLYDPGYRAVDRWLRDGRRWLKKKGYLLAGFGSFGRLDLFEDLVRFHRYDMRRVKSTRSTEGGPVCFDLYRLSPLPPSGRSPVIGLVKGRGYHEVDAPEHQAIALARLLANRGAIVAIVASDSFSSSVETAVRDCGGQLLRVCDRRGRRTVLFDRGGVDLGVSEASSRVLRDSCDCLISIGGGASTGVPDVMAGKYAVPVVILKGVDDESESERTIVEGRDPSQRVNMRSSVTSAVELAFAAATARQPWR